MIALGYTMVYGVLQLINFAHSEVFMIATVVTLYAFLEWFGVTGPLTGVGSYWCSGRCSRRWRAADRGRDRAGRIPPLAAWGAAALVPDRCDRGLARAPVLLRADGRPALAALLGLPNVLGPNLSPSPRSWRPRRCSRCSGRGHEPADPGGRRRGGDDVRPGSVRPQDAGRAGDPGGRPGPRHGRPDGRRHRAIVVVTFLVGGIMAGAAGILYIRRARRPIPLGDRVPSRDQGIRRGGARRDREHPRGDARRAAAGLVEAYGTACMGAQWQTVISFVVLVRS